MNRDIKLTTCRDPEFDLPKVQATRHHLYLDDVSRYKGKGKLVAGRGVARLVESAPDPNSTMCQKYGKAGHYRRGCAVTGKTNGRPRKSKKAGGKAADTMKTWCLLPKTTSHTGADGYKKYASRPKEGGVFPSIVLGAHTLLRTTRSCQSTATTTSTAVSNIYKTMHLRSKRRY